MSVAASSSGVLLVENECEEREIARSGLARGGVSTETIVIKSEPQALSFLRACSGLERASDTLPAVTVLGAGLLPHVALGLLVAIRGDERLKRMPIVVAACAPERDWVRSAYERGANSVVRWHDDAQVRAERYAALTRFWIGANETAPAAQAER
jgi:two-component system response regulator